MKLLVGSIKNKKIKKLKLRLAIREREGTLIRAARKMVGGRS
jgi:hypothetical protein